MKKFFIGKKYIAVKNKDKTELILNSSPEELLKEKSTPDCENVVSLAKAREKKETDLQKKRGRAKKSREIHFESAIDDRTELARYLYESYEKYQLRSKIAARYANNVVGCRIINENTIDEYVSWAIVKTLEKWNQHKMIKEYEILTSQPNRAVRELYSSRLYREKRIREIAEYFFKEVDINSKLIEFTELPQIWGYFKRLLIGKTNSVYNERVKNKGETESVEIGSIETILEINDSYSDYFKVETDNDAAETLRVLFYNIGAIDKDKKEQYLAFFRAIYIEGHSMIEASRIANVPQKDINRMNVKIKNVIQRMKECA